VTLLILGWKYCDAFACRVGEKPHTSFASPLLPAPHETRLAGAVLEEKRRWMKKSWARQVPKQHTGMAEQRGLAFSRSPRGWRWLVHPKVSKSTKESAKLIMADAEAKSLAGSRTRIKVSLQTQCKKKVI